MSQASLPGEPARSSVSVVIPTYNGTKFLREAIASVHAQTRLPQEIIAVDDASTDATLELLDTVARDSPMPLRILRLTTNSGGPAHPMNVGIRAATGEHIVTLDQDDRMCPERIERQVGLLERYPELSFVAGLWYQMDADGVGRPIVASTVDRYIPLTSRDLGGGDYEFDTQRLYTELVRLGNCLVGASNLAFHKSTWERLGGFSERNRCVWDYDFALRLCASGRIGVVGTPVNVKRKHLGNLTGNRLLHWREILLMQRRHLMAPLCELDPEFRSHHRRSVAKSLLSLAYHESLTGSVRDGLAAHWYAFTCGGRIAHCASSLLRFVPRRIARWYLRPVVERN